MDMSFQQWLLYCYSSVLTVYASSENPELILIHKVTFCSCGCNRRNKAAFAPSENHREPGKLNDVVHSKVYLHHQLQPKSHQTLLISPQCSTSNVDLHARLCYRLISWAHHSFWTRSHGFSVSIKLFFCRCLTVMVYPVCVCLSGSLTEYLNIHRRD